MTIQKDSIVGYAREIDPGDLALRFRVAWIDRGQAKIVLIRDTLFPGNWVVPLETLVLIEGVVVSGGASHGDERASRGGL